MSALASKLKPRMIKPWFISLLFAGAFNASAHEPIRLTPRASAGPHVDAHAWLDELERLPPAPQPLAGNAGVIAQSLDFALQAPQIAPPLGVAAAAVDEIDVAHETLLPAHSAPNARFIQRFFDGADQFIRGVNDEILVSEPEPSSADLPAKTAADLRDFSKLSRSRQLRVLYHLASHPPVVRGAPNFPAQHTYSLELELQVHKQLTDDLLSRLFAGDNRLTDREWAIWRSAKTLGPARWEIAWKHVVSNIVASMPTGWRLHVEGKLRPGANFLEIKTGSARDLSNGYHTSTPQEWSDLIAGLTSVQNALPGGFFSANIHNGRVDLSTKELGTSRLVLDIDDLLFQRVIKSFEAQFRALSGYGFAPAGAGLGVVLLELEKMVPPALKEYRSESHSDMINLSDSYPTIETKILTRLMKPRDGGMFFDEKTFAADVWWCFSLLNAFASPIDARDLGIPALAGKNPTIAQIAAFADIVFRDDLVGKALALSKLGALMFANAPAKPSFSKDLREVLELFWPEKLYQIHRAAAGHDPNWREKL